MAKEAILTRVEKDTKKQLEKIAEQSGLSLAALLRLIIKGIVEKRVDLRDLMPNDD
jgi:antitoxin component of RelBE/YafQ-DinJ toxin-antitoxin module